jgi:recombination protein RecR
MLSFRNNALENLISTLSRFPGVGRKTAQRLAVHILKKPEFGAELVQAVERVRQEVHQCRRCFNLAEGEYCQICADEKRDQHQICVVEDVVDLFAVESSQEYRGVYHVLGGVISPLAGVRPGDLKIEELIRRVHSENTAELLLALNPTTEGEATMIYISRLLSDSAVKITRIASGIPLGSNLEYIDAATIGRAIQTRRDL